MLIVDDHSNERFGRCACAVGRIEETNRFMNPNRLYRRTIVPLVAAAIFFMTGIAGASAERIDMPDEVMPALHYLLGLVGNPQSATFDIQQIEPLVTFCQAAKSPNAIYQANGSFDAPSAYHEFSVHTDLQRLIDYTMDTDIPSFFFWPSSLRLTRWTRVNGGDGQFDRLKAASSNLDAPFIFSGTEHVTITPDQHTGAYYTYDVDKLVILTPLLQGRAMISIYRQQKPSEVGRKGWVLGSDDEWSYLYTQETGLNVKGLGWANTYMYDSSGITVYYQPDPQKPLVTCSVVSWVNAGWAGLNMVKPRHIHRGLVRVATAFKTIMEDPRLPDPKVLAETFAHSDQLSTATLKAYARDYFDHLEQRLSASESLQKEMGGTLDPETALAQMNRDELYAVLALDYFKKLLGRNHVIDTHPF